MADVVPLPPRGHYLAHEAGRLAGVSGDRVGQWARRGYIRSSQSNGPPRVYSYQDVAEAMVVHELLEHDVALRDIRRTIDRLRIDYGDWPLTRAPLRVGAGRVYAEHGSERYDIGRQGWHQVFNVEKLGRIAEDLHRGGWAVRQVPNLQSIEVDPDRLSGQPSIRGRRVAAEDVAELADAAGGPELLRDDYGLSETQIDDAVRWWQAVQAYERAA